MKTLKIVGAVSVLALVIVSATLATAFAFGWGMQIPYGLNAAPGNAINAPQAYAPRMMAPITQTDTQTPTLYTPTYSNQGFGGWDRCWGRWGNGPSYPTTTATSPLTITQVTDIAKTYVASLNNADLAVKQVEEYTNNFYVLVGEKSTGKGAFELLVDKYSGVVRPEPGPNMMWNTQYTFGNGFCNWLRGTTTATPTVTVEQAKINAQQYLDSYLKGATVGDVTTFSGHYTIEVLSNGAPYGMLSVNAFTGQIWYHNWHGAFVQEQTVS